MKHPVWDRILILLCALVALGCAAGVVALLVGKISFDMITGWIAAVDMSKFVVKAAMVGIAALFVLLFLLLFAMILPSRKKRSSNYAIQRNENGMVRISLKALETLVNKCLNQHAELKVVTSRSTATRRASAWMCTFRCNRISACRWRFPRCKKQIKKYLEACSGVMVQEVRVFVDSTIRRMKDGGLSVCHSDGAARSGRRSAARWQAGEAGRAGTPDGRTAGRGSRMRRGA